MPKIVIDNLEIEVAAGTKVIEAAEKLGIMIPRFCYHPALGSVGACRVCAVKFLQGPFKGVQMSCTVDAQDDMVVSTTDEEAVAFRKYVIEWLMLHHPHDCPVCDEGGHCLLQDMTVSGGHGIRRYLGNKRTYADQYLGPLLQHEMNRCIHCYRCARFYQEFSGYQDLGAMQSANQTYFGRFKDGILESPFSGNLADICPTGVFTDRPSRFLGRRWDYERKPSLCINCALGCNSVASARYREVVRQEARFSKAVNGYFICDRGRYGFFYAGRKQRPRKAKIDGQEVAFDKAIDALKKGLAAISNKTSSGAIACAGSSRSSLETHAMLQRTCQANDWQSPAFFVDSSSTQKVKLAISRLESDLVVSLREIEEADFVLVIGADPLNEAPMLALALRQAQRRGSNIVVIDPRPISLPFNFEHLVTTPGRLNHLAGTLIKKAVAPDAVKSLGQSASEYYENIADRADDFDKPITMLADMLRQSQRTILVAGLDVVPKNTPSVVADLALILQATDKHVGLFYILPGANAFGAGMISNEKASFERIVAGIENGSIKGLILVECDPFWHFPDRQRLENAIDQLELMAVVDCVDSAAVQKADIFIPTTTLFEAGGLFLNQEGRIQAAPKVHAGGLPIAQAGMGEHPPRNYSAGIPEADAQAAWEVLAKLMENEPPSEAKPLRTNILNWLSKAIPEFVELPPIEKFPEDGLRVGLKRNSSQRFSVKWDQKTKEHGDRYELILTELTFGTEELSSYSECLEELGGTARIIMCPRDAEKLGLTDQNVVSIELDRGTIEAKLHVADNMAAGVVVIPRHKDLEWQKMGTAERWIRPDQIRKRKD